MTWQPIETAPKDGTRIYAVRYVESWPQSLYHVSTVYWQDAGEYLTDDYDGIWITEDRNDIEDPTHWMPLPEPPAIKGDKP